MALENFDTKDIKFKWPNDIFYNNKKFAGIILDTQILKNFKQYMIIGLGINVESSPILSEYPTTYLKEFSKVKSVPEFLIFFYKIFFENLNKIQNSQKNLFIDIYKKSLMFVGEKIHIKLRDNSVVKGIFKGINNDGSLKLENEHGLTSVYSGRIQI
jgi:BirA family biotin operon repressor/biotin-[acetyl-CoA-carboxylase] ligase